MVGPPRLSPRRTPGVGCLPKETPRSKPRNARRESTAANPMAGGATHGRRRDSRTLHLARRGSRPLGRDARRCSMAAEIPASRKTQFLSVDLPPRQPSAARVRTRASAFRRPPKGPNRRRSPAPGAWQRAGARWLRPPVQPHGPHSEWARMGWPPHADPRDTAARSVDPPLVTQGGYLRTWRRNRRPPRFANRPLVRSTVRAPGVLTGAGRSTPCPGQGQACDRRAPIQRSPPKIDPSEEEPLPREGKRSVTEGRRPVISRSLRVASGSLPRRRALAPDRGRVRSIGAPAFPDRQGVCVIGRSCNQARVLPRHLALSRSPTHPSAAGRLASAPKCGLEPRRIHLVGGRPRSDPKIRRARPTSCPNGFHRVAFGLWLSP